MKKPLLFILIPLLTLQSCVIALNENNYRLLSESIRNKLPSFNINTYNARVDHSKALHIYEINSRDIQAIADKHAYTWVHVWSPLCSNEYCQNISWLENFANQYSHRDMALILVSQEYNFKEINQIVLTSRYSRPIGIMESDYYGYKLKYASQKLYHDLTGMKPTKKSLSDAISTTEYFFRDGDLVFKASDMEAEDLAWYIGE